MAYRIASSKAKTGPALVLALFLFALPSFAATCPDGTDIGGPRTTETPRGIPLASPRNIVVQGWRFLVPAGYLNPWPIGSKDYRGDLGRLPFAFWMPTLRFPERNPIFTGNLRSCEAGRLLPGPDDFVVKARLEIAFREPLESESYYSVSKAQEREARLKKWAGGYRAQKYDLTMDAYIFSSQDEASAWISSNIDRERFRYLISCHYHSAQPLCHGHAFIQDDKLGFYLRFPARKLWDLNAIVLAARDLVISWKLEADAMETE
ncbi:MAG: hypothetical protein AAFY88_17790 [Acidobacteriota bacterium]